MYRYIIRPILFSFNPETAHKITFALLKVLRFIPGAQSLLRAFFKVKTPLIERELWGIKFKNPIGIAGGLDKNGEYYNDLASFGISFIEIGSITPKPQPGNPKPRCFRLVEDKAIINRMGINNNGVKYAVNQLKTRPPKDVVVVGNLSKNTITPNDRAAKDYEKSFTLLYDFVDLFVLNISCPNVKDLTELQDISLLSEIIYRIVDTRKYYDEYRPVLLKVSPDLPMEQIDQIVDLVLSSGIDGIVATNTTRSRSGLKSDTKLVDEIGNGGLSGAPLFERSLELVRYIAQKSNGYIPIVASGGIMTPQQAEQMLDAGASLIEIYSGFIYNGPAFIKKTLKHLNAKEAAKVAADAAADIPQESK